MLAESLAFCLNFSYRDLKAAGREREREELILERKKEH